MKSTACTRACARASLGCAAVAAALTLWACTEPRRTQAAPEPAPPPVPSPLSAEPVKFVSTPSGARVRLSTGASCTTPCTLSFPPDSSFSATFEKENYLLQTVKVRSNIEVVREFNAKKGVAVDAEAIRRSGTLKLIPNPVSVVLEPEWSK